MLYYVKGFWRTVVPGALCRCRLARTLARLDVRPDREYIQGRVDYYCRLSGLTPLPADAPALAEHTRKGANSVYFFDTQEFTRWFDPQLRWEFLFGDVITVPSVPSVVKSRPIAGDNAHSVVMNLNKVRHFIFLNDRVPFREKRDRAIFRGDVNPWTKPHRVQFLEMYFGSEACDCGITPTEDPFPAEWFKPRLSFREQLGYKYIMALEGNDVASNLKWVMSSNSVAVMPRPTYETWFMEGMLIPGYHYIEIRSDFSDLPEKLAYYSAHPDQAEAIIRHAHAYVEQFFDRRRERLISLLVLDKYFRRTGQYAADITDIVPVADTTDAADVARAADTTDAADGAEKRDITNL